MVPQAGHDPAMFTSWVADFKSAVFLPASPLGHTIKEQKKSSMEVGVYFVLKYKISPHIDRCNYGTRTHPQHI
jgi:hypothetical protein